MEKEKIQAMTSDLKVFLVNKKMKVSEVREVLFRLIDFIDSHYDEESRNVLFVNGNGNNIKECKRAQ